MKVEENNFNPLVSVIIPTYNRLNWIGECLDSVLVQSYPNFEIIVVDDGSSDQTAEWIRAQPKYQKVLVHVQENSGASVARNNGIEMSKGELVVFIDSDDLLLPEHLEKAVDIFRRFPETGLFCCDSKMIDAEGQILFDGQTWHQAAGKFRNYEVKTGFRSLEDVFMFSNCFPGFTLRREIFAEMEGFIQSIFPADDYDLALRVAGSDYKVYYLNEAFCLRREHDGQCSGIENSVKTCRQLLNALDLTLERHPELSKNSVQIRQRLADIQMELGMSQMKEGNNSEGLRTMLQSVIKYPKQIGKIAQIGGNRLVRQMRSK